MRRSSTFFSTQLRAIAMAVMALGLTLPLTAAPVPNWHSLGPIHMPSFEPSMGRVNFVTSNPGNPSQLLVCAPGGGLWSSVDSGQNWLPLTDQMPVVGADGVVYDPVHTNVIYLATGDADA